jgi:hypothetical protein
VNVPYSAEFRERLTNEPLLTSLASLKPRGGAQGELIEDPAQQDRIEELLKINSFRKDLPKATSSQEAWHLLVLVASVLFFYDVFVRRVTINLDWAKPYAARVRDKLLGREPKPAQPEYLARLRSRKAEVTEQIEQQKAATRFEPQRDAPSGTGALDEELRGAGPVAEKPRGTMPSSSLQPQKEEESYTDRLLKAKKKVWEDRERGKE